MSETTRVLTPEQAAMLLKQVDEAAHDDCPDTATGYAKRIFDSHELLRAQLAAAERERDEAQAEHTREVLLRTVAERERDEARARAAVSERFRAEDAHSHIVESAGYAEHRKTLLARAEAAEARAAQAVDDWLATRIAELEAEIKALPPYPYPGQDRRTPERDERDRKEGWLYGQFGALRAEQLRRRQ